MDLIVIYLFNSDNFCSHTENGNCLISIIILISFLSIAYDAQMATLFPSISIIVN